MTEYMTTGEVAELFRTPIETVRYWRHVSKGPKSFKVGRRVLYAREDVEAHLAQSRHEADAGRTVEVDAAPAKAGHGTERALDLLGEVRKELVGLRVAVIAGEIRIEDLGLTVRFYNHLKNSGVHTLGDLVDAYQSEVSK